MHNMKTHLPRLCFSRGFFELSSFSMEVSEYSISLSLYFNCILFIFCDVTMCIVIVVYVHNVFKYELILCEINENC